MTARDTYNASVANAHTQAQTGGVTQTSTTMNLPGAPVVPGNGTTWSRQSANAAFQAGQITQSQYNAVINALATWEQCERDNALAVLRASGDTAPA